MTNRAFQTLGSLCKIESGFAFKSSQWQDSGVPVVKIKNVRDGVVSLEGCAYVSEESAKKACAFKAGPDDVLISLTGYVGQVGRVVTGQEVLVNQRVGLVRPYDISDRDLIFYLLRSLRSQIEGLATGSAQPNVSPSDIMRLEIPIFSDYEMSVIAGVLRNFDDKIHVNQQISSTLEQIAQTVFKSWFVDFDPVHAKARGEQPVGMDAETAALFPDSFEDSELGPIPTGWKVQSADELFEMSIGRTPPRKEPQWFCDGSVGVPWVSIRDMGTFGVYSGSTNEGLTKEAVEKFKVPTVPADSVLMSFKLTVGKLCVTDRAVVTNEAIAHFKPNNSNALSTNFAYLWLKQFDVESLDSTSSIATATNSGAIRSISFLVPSDMVMTEFNVLMDPLFSEIKTLTHETQTLVQIRDSLLPRLISGELEIPAELLEA